MPRNKFHYSWRKIAITLIDTDFRERKAQPCVSPDIDSYNPFGHCGGRISAEPLKFAGKISIFMTLKMVFPRL